MTIRIPIESDPPPFELREPLWPRLLLAWFLGGVLNPIALVWTLVLAPGLNVSPFVSPGFWLVWLPGIVAATLALPILAFRRVRNATVLALYLMLALWVVVSVVLATQFPIDHAFERGVAYALPNFFVGVLIFFFWGALVAAFAGLPAALWWAAIVRRLVFKPRPKPAPTPTNSSDTVQPPARSL